MRMGFVVTEHRITVPLDHFGTQQTRAADAAAGLPSTITVFAREIRADENDRRPILLYLQGGPGSPSPRVGDGGPSWLDTALKRFRVLFLDQRGTGLSTPVDEVTLAGLSDSARARWMELLRADQIVADAEALRADIQGDEPWYTLGQSFGGFITLVYLSAAPEALRGCFVTGGLAGLTDVDTIYRETYRLTAARNRQFFADHPGTERWVRDVARHVRDTEEHLASGETLTVDRLRGIGVALGTRAGSDSLLNLMEDPFVEVAGHRRLSGRVLASLSESLSYQSAPLYAAIHESIYAGAVASAQGRPTAWAAARLRDEVPGFGADADPGDDTQPFCLFGEHIMPSLFLTDPALRPLRGAAHLLADKTDWPILYREDVLDGIGKRIPIHAAVYEADMFVPRDLSLDTARLVGAKTWRNDNLHDGLRVTDGAVLEHLLVEAGL